MMAGQGWLYKLVISSGAKSFLNVNRYTSVNYQQQASLKQATLDKLKQLNFPEKPKKPMTGYLRYLVENRDSIIRRNPSFKLVDIAKQCSIDWAEVHQDVKDKYTMEYKREMEHYNKKYLEYTAKLSEEQKEALAAASKEKKQEKKMRELRKRYKETGRPKRPIGPFMLFLLDSAHKENKKVNEIMISIKGKWNKLSDEERNKYSAQYEVGKKQYEFEMVKWEARMIREGNEDIIRRKAVPSAKPSRVLDIRPGKEE